MAFQSVLLLLVVALFLFAVLGGADQKMINTCEATTADGSVVVNFTITNTTGEEKTLGHFLTFEEVGGKAWAPASTRLNPGESVDKQEQIAWSEIGPETVTIHLNVENMDGDILASAQCGEVTL